MRASQGGEHGGHKPRFLEAQFESREGGNEDKALEQSEAVLRPATIRGDAQNKFLKRWVDSTRLGAAHSRSRIWSPKNGARLSSSVRITSVSSNGSGPGGVSLAEKVDFRVSVAPLARVTVRIAKLFFADFELFKLLAIVPNDGRNAPAQRRRGQRNGRPGIENFHQQHGDAMRSKLGRRIRVLLGEIIGVERQEKDLRRDFEEKA
ncbi:hypothetical protein DFH08DRAFT_822956 [Mycena albidolilacea]|uniref:Uncharacterized protein n=1 Tax=Mycena albidolilacea TaxID=1033008 RepID=A0AAD6Z873_9AGAR|nr:hypothetical protein DFH08DRAFT_822956 [Mycena albidolilacea]